MEPDHREVALTGLIGEGGEGGGWTNFAKLPKEEKLGATCKN